jgi:hypothetical protein
MGKFGTFSRGTAQLAFEVKKADIGSGTVFYIFFPLHAIHPDQSGAPGPADFDRLLFEAN